MAKYLISFPSEAMQLTAEELQQASVDSHAVVAEAKAAGVWVFGGGIDESIAPVLVSAAGAVSEKIHLGSRLTGGFAVFEVPTREEAIEWAQKLAKSCRTPQELRVFMFNPES
ncbi:YciI family protein [Oleiharenicola lentus]|uniref:YciI family protein n=1 Tax=Oleiharenicola lentus TaxID=2508720 RepID=UPI003F670315